MNGDGASGDTPLAQSGAAIEEDFSTLPAGSTQEPCTRPTWVEIRLVDPEGRPVPGAKYRIELPDGEVLEGTLDEDGLAGVDGIDPGDCKVTFPEHGTHEVEAEG